MNAIKIDHRICFIAGLLFFLQACSGGRDTGKVITVSILPQQYFVQKITGNKFEVEVLIPPGASPATYDPSPRQLARLGESLVYFRIGYIEFERTWFDESNIETGDLSIIDVSEGIDLLYEGKHGGHAGGHVDPHIWMSPANVRIIAGNIAEFMAEADPANHRYYMDNLDQFKKELEQLDKEISSKLDNLQNRKFFIYHPALTYFAEDYGLEQIALEHEGKEPSPAYLKKLIDLSGIESVPVIFIQKQFEREKAITLANETGARIIRFDPLDENWMEQMRHIGSSLAKTR